MLRRLVHLSALLLCLMGCTPNASTLSNPKSQINGFTNIEVLDPFPEVGLLLDNSRPKCTVTLIEDDVVLTAAHCVQTEGVYEVKLKGKIYGCEKIMVHPKSHISVIIAYDVALVFLDEKVKGIKPAKVNRCNIEGMTSLPLITVGYSRGFKKRSDLGTIVYIEQIQDNDHQLRMIPLMGTIFHGDSGGPVYSVVDGELCVIGVISYYRKAGGVVYENVAMRTDSIANWIASSINKV
jgi:hypothetical protein